MISRETQTLRHLVGQRNRWQFKVAHSVRCLVLIALLVTVGCSDSSPPISSLVDTDTNDPNVLKARNHMDSRLSYNDTIQRLQKIGMLGVGESPPMPDHRPRFDDEEPLGFSFFRTMAADDDLGDLTLRRTYFAKSEIKAVSFRNTDLSESTLCWNDFIDVDFSSSTLADSDMRASLFSDCNLNRADLSGCDMRRSSFDACTFDDAKMNGAILSTRQKSELQLSSAQSSAIDWRNDDGPEPPGG